MTHKALDNAEMILDEDIDVREEPEQFGPLLRAKTSVLNSILATQTKVDETRLRRQTLDRLPALLKLINETEASLPAPIEAHPL